MNVTAFISRCLSILAVVGMLAVQTTGPAIASSAAFHDGGSMAAMDMGGMAMTMADADHCPGRGRTPADCGKTCPWAVLCVGSCLDAASSPELTAVAWRRVVVLAPVDEPAHTLWADGPPARPPRT